ncbi:MAG TPA: hypothetical protein VFA80_10325 [Xanthobacteraceae bacterium]|nr:hypothetical protein [Xanthobacteraceae bacterium]
MNSSLARKAQEKSRASTNKRRLPTLRLAEHETPKGAVTWTPENIEKWRRDFMAEFGDRSPLLCLALEVLPHVAKRGYAARDNEYLMAQTGLGRSVFYDAFRAINERRFFIVGDCNGERRIWLGNPVGESGDAGLRSPAITDSKSGDTGLTNPAMPDSSLYRDDLRDTERERESEQPSDSPEQAANVVVFAVGRASGVASVVGRTAPIGDVLALSDDERRRAADIYECSASEVALLDGAPVSLNTADLVQAIRRFGGQGTNAFKAWDAIIERRRATPMLPEQFEWRPASEAVLREWSSDKQGMKAKGYQLRPNPNGNGWQVRRQRRPAA